MINLLPSETIASNYQRYRWRWLWVASLLFLSVLLLAGGVLLYFTWVVRTRAGTVNQQLIELKKRAEAKELIELERNWRSTEHQVKALANLRASSQSPAVIWSQLLAGRPAGVRLTDIGYVLSGATTTVSVKGEAATRKIFLTFLEQLRSDKTFSSVDSPVDNLIKDRGATFVIKLELHAVN